MKVGDYVRTKHYGIFKILKIIKENGNVVYLKKPGHTVTISDKYNPIEDEIIGKPSENPIDLIQVGDYVNGLKITSINEPSMANCNKRLLYAEDEEGYLIKMFGEEDIKSIVTKEQFKSIQYNLESEVNV